MSKYWDIMWSPSTGCSPLSDGCTYCWAKRWAKRFGKSFKVQTHPARLRQPIDKRNVISGGTRYKKGDLIAVCFTGDLFHEEVPKAFIQDVFEIMKEADDKKFIVCTKRTERMWSLLMNKTIYVPNALENVILLTTVESQKYEERIPLMQDLSLELGWKIGLSIEPMLGTVNSFWSPFDWVIVGAENAAYKRVILLNDIRKIVDTCKGVTPCFVKQVHLLKKSKSFPLGKVTCSMNPDEWPESLRVQEYPKGFERNPKRK